MMRRILLLLAVVGLVAAAIWLPREEDVSADTLATDLPVVVSFRAERATATPPFTERWDLSYPDTPPADRVLTLQVGPLTGSTATGRLTAGPGRPAAVLERIALVLAVTEAPASAAAVPPTDALDLRLNLLGERLSAGSGDVGATVIADAFVASPAGDWRVYRMAVGEAGPQIFLGLNERAGTAVLLPRALADGPALLARFRALLLKPAATS